MIKIMYKNQEYLRESPLYMEDFMKEMGVNAVGVKVNNRLRELTYKLTNDANIEFVDLSNFDSIQLYSSSIRFLITMAVNELFPQAHIIFYNSISRSIYFEILNNGPVTPATMNQIDNKMQELIKAKLPIKRHKMTKDEAIELYRSRGLNDKAELLAFRPEPTVNMYKCGDFINYMYSYMVPNTSYLSHYKLRLYSPGIIVQLPRAEFGGAIPPFEDAPTFQSALHKARLWGNICQGSHVSQMNKMIEEGKELEFINLCETKHNDMLAELGHKIEQNIDTIRLIAVAGPSSSGKTTFTNRLRIELKARGINPLMISIDNYYLAKEDAPKDEYGKPDLEHLNALDVELFNQQMYSLISGEEVTLPYYNFETGQREELETVKLDSKSPILIEGIHALNDDLTPSIPLGQKFKIYIAPQAQLHLDDHNPISLTELRLIRRLVRDHKFRNSSAEETLSMWPSVRRGEFRWIYKNQEGVNYVYNSELSYEICVLKKYAIPLLREIPYDSPYFVQANRLLKFLKYFKDIEDEWIPSNSIIREFIGGSIFYRK